MKLILFDIDGTLINTGGAGSESMRIAFEQIWGIPDGFKNIFMMGKTDSTILREVLKNNNLTWDEDNVNTFLKYYFQTLKQEIKKDRSGKRICPGIIPLLESLYSRTDFSISLLTGNFKESAFIKLNHFNIDHYFQDGAFCNDTENREEMVPIIKKRTERKEKITIHNNDIFVIGDTPSDINSARKNGVHAVGVTTGVHTYKDLQAHNPDHLFTNLSDTASVLQILRG
ncbi:MAG: HAD family hydrolase [bacterium]